MENTTEPRSVEKLTEDVEWWKSRAVKLQQVLDSISNNLTEENWFDDYLEKSEVLEQLCHILDVSPTKTVAFEARLSVSGTVQVSLLEDYDIGDIIESSISVESIGDAEVGDYSIDSVYEN